MPGDPRVQPFAVVLSITFVSALIAFRLWRWSCRRRVRFAETERNAERERIARELHDTLLQDIQAMLLRLDRWASDNIIPTARRGEIAAVAQQARALVIEGRDRILMLRQPETDLLETLRSIGASESATSPVRVDVFSHGQLRALAPPARDHIVGTAREAIRNAIRHAHPSTIEVEVSFRSTHLEITVTDDGCGIDDELAKGAAAPGHFGLLGMRERAEQLTSRLRILRLVPSGTRVSLRVPAGVAFRISSRRQTHL
jgi:signal transduction histidine kinase